MVLIIVHSSMQGYKIGAHVRSAFVVKIVSVLKEADIFQRFQPGYFSWRTRLTITLWGTFVDQIVGFMSKHSEGPIVIAIQYCKIKDYNGSKTLSNSMYASQMFINSNIPEILEFHNCLRPEETTSPINPDIHNSGVPASPLEVAFSYLSLSTTQDLFLAGDSSLLLILVSVLQINSDRGWFYDSCSRYKIDLMVLDHSGTANITVFDRDTFNILGITTMDLRKENLQV
ncbi:replication protein A 70 kDa DNA-binding subunit-like [Senna tora]|uniref:Replication protein A 70 kDa DNA-binding subunit-like n=1 Tax=Senna tora TaxID=362788 RepID=A0A834WTB7_9FABA|nr:replication protein A 70 kDa DNA-binding subunit-like [Senna tora]